MFAVLATYTDEEIEEIVEQEKKNPHYDVMLRLTEKRVSFNQKGSLEQAPAEA